MTIALGFKLLALGFILILFSFTHSSAQSVALKQFLENKELKTAHVGVYVYDDSSKKVIAEYQSDKYFVPASNVKLFTLYAGMKYLGDSIEGTSFFRDDTAIFISATGDPTLLHPDFQSQPVIDFLKKSSKKIYLSMNYNEWQEKPWGPGWAWDDYNDNYSAERSPLPVYGNFIRWHQEKSPFRSNAAFEPTATAFSSPEIPWKVRFSNDSIPKTFLVKRLIDSNVFVIRLGNESEITQDVPFVTEGMKAAAELLQDTLGKPVGIEVTNKGPIKGGWVSYPPASKDIYTSPYGRIYSRPVDSVFVPMMYSSDNFFAEQVLLMVSRSQISIMNDESIIDTILNDALTDLPQKPEWVDGSGLSRYNLFTPQDFVTLLVKMKNEFGMDRIKRILPTGGKGTLKNYYHADSGLVFAKTGSMNGVLCLSGYMYTAKKHLLEFSILVNNNTGNSSSIRREIENYVEDLRKNN